MDQNKFCQKDSIGRGAMIHISMKNTYKAPTYKVPTYKAPLKSN